MEDYTLKQAITHHGNIPLPPGNNTTNATFIDQITELLADRIAKCNNMVILGDLNIHANDLSNKDSYIYNDTMHAFGFK